MFVSVTRLKLRSVLSLPAFLRASRLSVQQAVKAPGFIAGRTLLDRGLAFWTITAWENERAMKAYRGAGSHREVMPRLADWCSEAAFAHWDQEADELPSWADAHNRLGTSGKAAPVNHPSARQKTLRFPSPVVSWWRSRPFRRAAGK